MDDNAFECPECLKKIPGAEVLIKQKQIEKKEKTKKAAIIIGSTAALIILVIAAVLGVTALSKKSSDNYRKPIDTYIRGCVMNDYGKYISSYTPYYAKFMTEQFAYSILNDLPKDDEKVQHAAVLYFDSYYQQLTATYGNDFEIKYDIASETKYEPDKLKQLQDEYISYNKDELQGTVFEDAYDLKVAFNISGALGKKTLVKDLMVCKINGDWKVMYYVDFLKDDSEQTTDIENFKK